VARKRGCRRAKDLGRSFFVRARGSSKVPSIAISSGPAFGANFRYYSPKIGSEKLSISHRDREARRLWLQQARTFPHRLMFSHRTEIRLVDQEAAGAGVVAGQNVANAFAAMFYPTYIRATGVGWALGIGRIGAIVGPTVGGIMLALHWSRAEMFGAAAIPSVIAAFAILGLLSLERAKEIVPPAQQPLSSSH